VEQDGSKLPAKSGSKLPHSKGAELATGVGALTWRRVTRAAALQTAAPRRKIMLHTLHE
jgi:hypothetical protein